MKPLITLLLAISWLPSIAQEIAGKILDDKKEPLPSAGVLAFRGSVLKGSVVTDYDGDYSIKLPEPGYYREVVFYSGFDSVTIHDIIVSPGQRTTQNFILTKSVSQPKNIVKQYRKPLIDRDKTDIDILTSGRVDDIISNPGGWVQAPRTSPLVDVNVPNQHILTVDEIRSIPEAEINELAGWQHRPSVTGTACILPLQKRPEPVNFITLSVDQPDHLVLTRREIAELPVSDLRDMLTLMPGVYQQKRGDEVNIFGARADGNLYIADKMQLLR
jgi:carboxypeptidase family protein